MSDSLRHQLISWVHRYSNGPQMLLNKLCQALAALSHRMISQGHKNVIINILNEMEQTPNMIQEFPLNNALLTFLTVLPEEFSQTHSSNIIR